MLSAYLFHCHHLDVSIFCLILLSYILLIIQVGIRRKARRDNG